jgi:hypothetical protein
MLKLKSALELTPEELLTRYPPIRKMGREPMMYSLYSPEVHGKGGDPDLLYPEPNTCYVVEQALDQLDAGASLREAAAWLTSQGLETSHVNIRKLWDKYRPDHRRPEQPKSLKLSPAKKKLLHEKRALEARERQIQKSLAKVEAKKQKLSPKPKPKLIPVVKTEDSYDHEAVSSLLLPQQEVIFKPNPGPQTEYLAASEQEVLYGGSAGSGKSYATIADPMRYFDNKNFNGLILRRTNDELRELIWKSKELYPKLFPGARFAEQKSSWSFPAGGHLWMTYLERDDDVMRYHGQAFNYIAFDELTQYPTPFAWNFMRSRLRTTDPNLPLFMRATSNPGGPGHGWVKKMFIDPSPPNVAFPATDLDTGEVIKYPAGHAKAGQPLFYRRFIPARLSDNPYLFADGLYEANLLSLPENQRRQLLEGDWSVADGAAFSEFRTHIHTCDPFKIPSDWLKFRSCDWGYSERQATCVHWYAMDPRNGSLVVYRELYVNKHTGRELAAKIKELEYGENISYGVLDHNAWGSNGAPGPTPAEEMIKAGVRWRKADKGPNSRIASKHRLHELLRVDPISKKPGIIFFNTCRHIIATLPIIPMSKEDDDIDKKFADDHAYDSIRYGIQSRPTIATWDTPRYKFTPSDSIFGY